MLKIITSAKLINQSLIKNKTKEQQVMINSQKIKYTVIKNNGE